MVSEEPRCAILIDLAGGDGEDELIERGVVCFDHIPVLHQKNARRYDGNSLVTVHEGVIAS